MLLRVFAMTDDSELGLACLDWVRFLIALDQPVRIASAAGAAEIMGDHAGRSPNPWSTLRSHFATPLESPYVNILLTPSSMWDRFWASRAARNVAIVPLHSLTPIICTKYFDAIVFGWERHDWAGSDRFSYIAPLAENLERFRTVVLP